MKKLAVVLLCLPASGVMAAETTDKHKDEAKNGYSYFTAGIENITYREFYPGLESEVTVTSPVINTGGLYEVNDKFDFSIDALGTFSPGSSKEEWSNSKGVSKTNQFEYVKASTNILLHYKVTPQWRVVAGPSLTYQTYKRYQSKTFRGEKKNIFVGTWEEQSTDIFADFGVVYDSGSLRSDNPWHINLKAIAGLPVWSTTTNTAVEGLTFNDFGYRTSLEGSVSYQVMKGIHVGWYALMGYEKRFETDSQFWKVDEDSGKKLYVTLPEAETISLSTGLQVLWNLG